MLLEQFKSKKQYYDYHDKLSSTIWDDFKLKPEILTGLRKIADKFIETLGVESGSVSDIQFVGSLCNYNYTKFSDIDLHVILEYDEICEDCKKFSLDDCMKAKKSLWNEQHEITVYGYDVELYVQDTSEGHVSAGTFSIKDNKWVTKPKKEVVKFDHKTIKQKAKAFMYEIDEVIDSEGNDIDDIDRLIEKIKKMRKSGLEKHGEMGLENLVFKVLRNSGYIEKLYDYKTEVEDNSLSIE